MTITTASNALPARSLRAVVKARHLFETTPYIQWLNDTMAERLAQTIPPGTSLIHCHDYVAAMACGRIAKRDRPAIVTTLHGPASRHAVENGYPSESAVVRCIARGERAAWASSDRLIAVDSGQRDILLEQGATPDRIDVIFNAVDVGEIDSYKTPEPPLKYEYCLVPRRLAPKNGVEYAIEAFALLPSTDMKLAIAGDGPSEKALRQLVADLHMQDRVLFLGALAREDVIKLMWHAAAVIVPSVIVAGVAEASSLAALEAMGAGRPVIASRIGGLNEIIVDGKTGMLVSERSTAELASSMQQIVTRPTLAHNIGIGARTAILQQYSLDQWIAKIEGTYERALSSARHAAALS